VKKEAKKAVAAQNDRPHARISEDRVEELLDIAAQVFAERGFDGASVSEMAKRANASKGTYYSRYPSKEALLMAVMGRRVEGLEAELSSVMGSSGDIEATLTEFASRVLTVVLSEQMLSTYRVVTLEARRFPSLGKAYFENGVGKIVRFLSDYFSQISKAGKLKVEHPEMSAELFIDSIVGIPRMKAALGLGIISRKEKADRIRVAVQTFLSAHRL
jgi:TetR/AcrR family transcriptional regulator, mexJK operon transcriptional repressor